MPYLLSDLDDRSFLKNRRTDFRTGSLSQYRGGVIDVKATSVGGGMMRRPQGLGSRMAYKAGRALGSVSGRAKRIGAAVAKSKVGQKIGGAAKSAFGAARKIGAGLAKTRVGGAALGMARKGIGGVKRLGGGGLGMARKGLGAVRKRVGFSYYDLPPTQSPKLLSYRR